MNENLKRHRPDIMLDVKDRTIRDYEDNYLPRPKTMSAKSWMIGSPETGEQWVYDAEEVDRVIAAKDKKIEDLKKKLVDMNRPLDIKTDPIVYEEYREA